MILSAKCEDGPDSHSGMCDLVLIDRAGFGKAWLRFTVKLGKITVPFGWDV